MKKLFLTLTILAVCMGVRATNVLTLTLDQAVELALNENRTVRIADMEIQRVDYSKRNAWNNVLPSLDATGQFAKFVVPGEMAMMGQVMNSPADFTAQAGLQLSLPLFAPALWQSIRMTALDMQLAVERAQASKLTLRNDVTKAFYGVLLAKDSYQTLQNGLALADDVFEQTKKRFELGLASEFDVISAEVQVKNLQPTIMEVKNGIEQAKMFLKVLMGVDIQQPIDVEGSLADYGNSISSSNASRNLSVNENSDLRQLDIQQQQLERALSMQRTQRMPMVAAFGTYGYSGMGNRATIINFGGMPIPVEKGSDWFSQGLLVGLQLNVPLTGIFTNIPRERQTQIQINQLSEQRRYLEDLLNMQVRTALNNMDRAAKQAEVAKENEKLAQRGYEIALRRYEAGMGIMLEVQNASNQLMQAQLSHNQAIASYLNTKADLEKLLGTQN